MFEVYPRGGRVLFSSVGGAATPGAPQEAAAIGGRGRGRLRRGGGRRGRREAPGAVGQRPQ